VLAASIAVAVNIAFSISTSIWLSAICYLLVGAVALALARESPAAWGAVAASIDLPPDLRKVILTTSTEKTR
jgi:xanthine/uracil/vitamin C permease (AzgA family)